MQPRQCRAAGAPIGHRVEQYVQPSAAGQAEVDQIRAMSVAAHDRLATIPDIRGELTFQAAIGEIADHAAIGQHRQLRTDPARETALYPDDGAQRGARFAGSSQRGMVLIQ